MSKKQMSFAIWATTLITALLGLFTAMSWIALVEKSNGFAVVMTQFFGKAEHILDVAFMSGAVIMGVILLIILFKKL